jgi:AbiEi antitoxin C-terminal domain
LPRKTVPVPALLSRRANRVLRPRDALDVYAHPRAELARLAHLGVVSHLATGYYAMVPPDRLGDDRWQPELDAAALGLAQADYGVSAVALMGTSAARHHGAIPRALAVAVVAVPKQRPALDTHVGRVVFVKRDVTRLDLERIDTPLTSGWVTTPEQTLLDLADRPSLGGLTEAEAGEAVRALAARVDWPQLAGLAARQRKPGALRTAAAMADPPA